MARARRDFSNAVSCGPQLRVLVMSVVHVIISPNHGRLIIVQVPPPLSEGRCLGLRRGWVLASGVCWQCLSGLFSSCAGLHCLMT